MLFSEKSTGISGLFSSHRKVSNTTMSGKFVMSRYRLAFNICVLVVLVDSSFANGHKSKK